MEFKYGQNPNEISDYMGGRKSYSGQKGENMKLTDLMLTTKERREYCSDHNDNCGNNCEGCERYDSERAAIIKAIRILGNKGLKHKPTITETL